MTLQGQEQPAWQQLKLQSLEAAPETAPSTKKETKLGIVAHILISALRLMRLRQEGHEFKTSLASSTYTHRQKLSKEPMNVKK